MPIAELTQRIPTETTPSVVPPTRSFPEAVMGLPTVQISSTERSSLLPHPSSRKMFRSNVSLGRRLSKEERQIVWGDSTDPQVRFDKRAYAIAGGAMDMPTTGNPEHLQRLTARAADLQRKYFPSTAISEAANPASPQQKSHYNGFFTDVVSPMQAIKKSPMKKSEVKNHVPLINESAKIFSPNLPALPSRVARRRHHAPSKAFHVPKRPVSPQSFTDITALYQHNKSREAQWRNPQYVPMNFLREPVVSPFPPGFQQSTEGSMWNKVSRVQKQALEKRIIAQQQVNKFDLAREIPGLNDALMGETLPIRRDVGGGNAANAVYDAVTDKFIFTNYSDRDFPDLQEVSFQMYASGHMTDQRVNAGVPYVIIEVDVGKATEEKRLFFETIARGHNEALIEAYAKRGGNLSYIYPIPTHLRPDVLVRAA